MIPAGGIESWADAAAAVTAALSALQVALVGEADEQSTAKTRAAALATIGRMAGKVQATRN